MRKMLRLKQRMALVLSAAMVLSAPPMQTFAKQMDIRISSTEKKDGETVA